MAALFSRLFKRKAAEAAGGESFAAGFHRFRLFLSAYIEAYGEMMDFEERLAAEMPFGMPFLRLCTAKLTVASMQCILQLNALASGRFKRLDEAFSTLRSNVRASLDKGLTPLDGPRLVPYCEVSGKHSGFISANLTKLEAIRLNYPEFMPRGFIVTGAAWWEYFNNPDMHDEIDRIMIISQDDPGSFAEAGAAIRERMSRSFPLPSSLEEEVRELSAARYPEIAADGHVLLVRCLPVRDEHGALVMPEQLLRTPVAAADILKAIQSSFSTAYRSRAIIYRLKRGIRDRAMPLCVALTLIPAVHARGSVHRGLDRPELDELLFRVRSSFNTPEHWPSQASVEGASLPEKVRGDLLTSAREALDCLKDAPVRGNRHEVFWAAAEDGRFFVLGVNALPDPAVENMPPPPENPACIAGGVCAYPGSARGRARPVRNFEEALLFPIGDILLLQRPAPRWSFLLDFASGVVTGDGTGNGLFARTARRYGRPAVLRRSGAFERFEPGEPLLVDARAGSTPLVCPVDEEELGKNVALLERKQEAGVPGAAWPLAPALRDPHTPPLWLPDSDLADIARELAANVVTLTLPDADSLDFRAENCRTFHDFLTYCHVHAVREMFRAGASRKTARAPAKQLVSDVPTQFWIINLDDGFRTEIKGPVVNLTEIASLPMLALWEGFTEKTWEGPPALNARGFLSVLFEATVNPDLDPASQSTQYTEKNVFLIAERFCSMSCRFGFHFLAMDCLLSERDKERFIIFQFKGGAANLTRRIRRVHFVAELLSQFDFSTEISGDTLTARLERGSEKDFMAALRILGYLTMHTRQLDMIMGDEAALAARRFQMLEDMLALAGKHE